MARRATQKPKHTILAYYYGVQMVLIGLLSVIAIGVYFWGAVQIDFMIRGNSNLEKDRDQLSRECDDLRIQINGLESFQRIAKQAEQQGMAMPKPADVKELHVDFSGVEYYYTTNNLGLRYAGMDPLSPLRDQRP